MFGQREALPRIPSQKKIPPPLRRDSATVAKDSGCLDYCAIVADNGRKWRLRCPQMAVSVPVLDEDSRFGKCLICKTSRMKWPWACEGISMPRATAKNARA